MEKEIRNIKSELRNANGRHIEGYAIMFNSQSEDMGFYETIEPSAIESDNQSLFLLFFGYWFGYRK